jgi:N-acetyl-gamma-glutamyl-phosphate reductase
MCRIAVHRPQGGDVVVVLSVIDNPEGGGWSGGSEHEHPVRASETTGLGQIPVMP